MNDDAQISALEEAIIQRAQELAEEHVNQGKMTRNRIMQDARDKVQLMEKKELLLAKENAEREYQRLVQASELHLKSELDRNRWGMVQSVMDSVVRQTAEFAEHSTDYESVLFRLLENGAKELKPSKLVAELNHRDHQTYVDSWDDFTAPLGKEILLSDVNCECSGGVRLLSTDGSMMVDNTFDGIFARNNEKLMRIIFERLFSQVHSIGGASHG